MIPIVQRKAQIICTLCTIASAVVCLFILTFILHTSLFAAPLMQEPTAAEQTGAVAGHVTGSDGGSVEGVSVSVFGLGSQTAYTNVAIDTSGNYLAAGLPPGSYSVNFNSEDSPPYLSEYYNNTRVYDALTPVEVAANNTTGNINAELQLGGIITGIITDEVSGAPLSGIPVEAFSRVDNAPNRTATTDATGHYEIIGLYGGNYKVCFSFNGSQSTGEHLPECYDNKSPGAEPEPLVTVTEGAVLANINAALTRGGVIGGQVTSDLNGEPLAGIEVVASDIDSSYNRFAITDEDGVYNVIGLPTGNYRVSFNWFGGNQTHGSEYYNNKLTAEEADTISVTVGTTTPAINAALDYILNITGRVQYANNHEPIGGLEIRAYDASGERHLWSGFSDWTGQYSITRLAPGPYRIRFGDDTFVAEYYSDSVIFEDAESINIADNVPIHNLDASLTLRSYTDLNIASATSRPDALIATREGSFTPLFTLDGGQQWHIFDTQPYTTWLRSTPLIALAPKDDPNQPVRFMMAAPLYSSSDTDGIHRSADNGATWSRLDPLADGRCNLNSAHDVDVLVTSPAAPLRAYAVINCTKTVLQFEPINFYYWTLYTSADGGVGWASVDMPLEPTGDSAWRQYTALPSPVLTTRLYMKRYEDSYSKIWARSDNNGQSWLTETFTVPVVALDWVDAAKLYGVEDHGDSNAFRYTGKRSIDTGATWQDWAQQPCRTSFQQLITLPAANTLLMLCDQGLFRSSNGGDSWQLLTSQSDGRLVANSGDRNQVLWLRGSEFWSSGDQGSTWSHLPVWSEAALPNIRLQH